MDAPPEAQVICGDAGGNRDRTVPSLRLPRITAVMACRQKPPQLRKASMRRI